MFLENIIIVCLLQVGTSEWADEWMNPIRQNFDEETPRKGASQLKDLEDEYKTITKDGEEPSDGTPVQPTAGLHLKLEKALKNAKDIAATLKKQINIFIKKEKDLKNAIQTGTSGVSTVTVHTMNQQPRTYIIREEEWWLCSGIIQTPINQGPVNLFNGMYLAPRCIGQEIRTSPDPCVFNSVIKYEIIPMQRRAQYMEDNYYCLRNNINTTLERYMSVPKRLINDTCTNGMVRSLEENFLECSVRILTEYNFYPERKMAVSTLPLEYCVEKDGSCKLIVAWHISNDTVENFEFLTNEPNFKQYFIKPDTYKY